MTYDEAEEIIARTMAEVSGEPRIGRFERTMAAVAVQRLVEAGMPLDSTEQEQER